MKKTNNIKTNSIIKHFITIGIGTFINLILGVFTTPLITRIVDPIEYGKLSIFTMYSGIALLILCLGMDQALVRYYYVKKDDNYKSNLLFRCIKLPVIISLVVSVIIVFLSYMKLIKLEFNTFYIILLCLYTIIQILYRFSMALVRLEYNSKLYSTINILIKLFYILIALPLLLLIKKSYFLILVISTIMSCFICLLISVFSQVKLWNFMSMEKDNNIISLKKLIKYAYPFIISMSITTLFQAIDKISLNYFYTYYEVGIYSSTMSLIHVFAIIQTTFNSMWMPMAVKHYTDSPEDTSFYIKGNNIITVIMFFFGLSLVLIKDVFAILLGSRYREAAFILPFLIFNPIMYTISETTVCGLVFKEKSKMQVLVALGACITNIIGNVILVPKLGCKGAAISTGISYIVFFMLRTLLSNRYYKINFETQKIYFITFCSCLFAFYNTFHTFDLISLIGYLVCITFIIILYRKTIDTIFNYSISFIKRKIKRS